MPFGGKCLKASIYKAKQPKWDFFLINKNDHFKVSLSYFHTKRFSTGLAMQVQAISASLRVKSLHLYLQLFCTHQQIKMVKLNVAIKTAISSRRYIFTKNL